MSPMGHPYYKDLKPAISMSSLYSDVKSTFSNVDLPKLDLTELKFPEIKFSEINIPELSLPDLTFPFSKSPNLHSASSSISTASTATPSLANSKSTTSLFSSDASTITGSYCSSGDCKVCGSLNFKATSRSQWKRNLDPKYLRQTYCPFEKARQKRDRRVAMAKYEREFSVVPWSPSSPVPQKTEM
ncbi:hypothetical protein EJ08DRAFT_692247 [Tothia fuscella]|uniref:Uncharacterized protein n=1 Tax=Tothia fuscella TaxID=1048955 RepID=A0A9P4P010_9PEZI|nr:hypothetical protein EJ08DRAFT_692247 [Tothia fuscella]